MSESPSRSRSQLTVGPTTVIPQQVTDPTILDSVAGFINEVVPTTHNGPYDTKDQILWANFEQIDCDSTSSSPVNCEYEKIAPPAIILVLGYTTGIQVWAIPANGEATEILSWRHGSVRILRFLAKPFVVGYLDKQDIFHTKRPLVVICDSTSTGPQFSSLNFLSLKSGEQVKVIKFKNPVLDVLSNRRSVVVAFQEKIAVFDAFTLEDLHTVTTCYLSPGLQPNPVALGSRWMAYAEKRLNPSKRSSGGNDGEGVQSYTATVLHAAKSLGRGLREFGESVASSLTGNTTFKPGTSPSSPQAGGQFDIPQKGVVTILDLEIINEQPHGKSSPAQDLVIAHFTAHTEAIVFLKFDPSGLLLFTADKRGHDFHLFRIHPHPGGPALATVNHLYVLHRGDTSARVQDMCFSPDSRWASVSTLRGTTHVFPITPYGGNVGVRTHATPHVVNKMSRFHRSAGLTVDGRSNSPVSMCEPPISSHFPFHNPRFPPYPHPTVVHPLAQIRPPVYIQNTVTTPQRPQTGRQRLSSSSDDIVSLRVVSCFASPRAWLDILTRDTSMNKQTKPVESLFIMSCYGTLIQYDLDPHQVCNIPKERVSSETPIELLVCAKAQWLLQRQPGSVDTVPPMTEDNLSYIGQDVPVYKKKKPDHNDEHWLSQVEILTHAGPHRRLWMGPQFTFKTYTTSSGSPLSLADAQPIDLGHTKPVNMPITKANAILIESSSASSCEQSLLETYHRTLQEGGGIGELQLKEDLADAMMESPAGRENGGRCVIVQMKPAVAKVVNPLGTVVNIHSDDEVEVEVFEEVIHENCDEALFRPFVASKGLCHGKTKQYVDSIITKSLESTTEVAVKILDKTDKLKSKMGELFPKNVKEKLKSDLPNDTKVKVEFRSKLDHSTDVPSQPLNIHLKESIKSFTFDLPPLDNEDFFSLENFPKSDSGGEEFSIISDEAKKRNQLKNEISCTLDGFTETNTLGESIIEERSISKRARKPKTKLGVKIVNIGDENVNTEKTLEHCSAEITLPAPPKKSWSNIAASKPIKEKSSIDCTENEKDTNLDLSRIEFLEEYTVHLPRKSPYSVSDLIDINIPHEEDSNKELLVAPEDVNLVKLDKSSDDEKGESSNSPVEASESDDSGKVPELSSVFEDLTDSKTTLVTVTKPSRRRKKKK
ncbi:hypothetical protein JTB14_028336 [Gonioctena quinquepunctata]|nr:hypothetical protein JTB14_028336 [Gonioctena quinquepunctata]